MFIVHIHHILFHICLHNFWLIMVLFYLKSQLLKRNHLLLHQSQQQLQLNRKSLHPQVESLFSCLLYQLLLLLVFPCVFNVSLVCAFYFFKDLLNIVLFLLYMFKILTLTFVLSFLINYGCELSTFVLQFV